MAMRVLSNTIKPLMIVVGLLSMTLLASQGNAKGVPDGFADLVEKLTPAVVNIATDKLVKNSAMSGDDENELPPGFEEFLKKFVPPGQRAIPFGQGPTKPRHVKSLGTGFIIDGKNGLVVTNNHVVADSEKIFVFLSEGQKLEAKLLGTDPRTDVALLKVSPGFQLPELHFGDSDKSRIGDWVIAIGNPHGLGGTVTAGIISARGRDIGSGPYDDFIQTDASINPGNSGGPLINMNGEVIGINSAILAGGNGGSIGIGFAIPSDQASQVVNQLEKFGETRRGWLGVEIQNVTEDIIDSLGLPKSTKGALVSKVMANSPAATANFKEGDIIQKFDNSNVDSSRELSKIVANTDVGKQVSVIILRQGKPMTLSVMLGRLETANLDKPSQGKTKGKSDKNAFSAFEEKLGLQFAAIDNDVRQQFELDESQKGLVIVAVKNDSDAAGKGIRPGMVVEEINQRIVNNREDAEAAVKKAQQDGRGSVLLRINDGDGSRYLAIKLK